MDKSVIIAGLDHWRIEAQKALGFSVPNIMRATAFDSSESAETLGKKFQLCLREFYMEFRKAGRLTVYHQLLSKALVAGYEKAGALRGKGVDEFLKYVIERDQLIGLKAGGERINEHEFIYWIKDMFYDSCQNYDLTEDEYAAVSTDGYLRTKINYFLPEPNTWITEMTKSPFIDERTEWRIYRKSSDANKLVNPTPTRELVAVA